MTPQLYVLNVYFCAFILLTEHNHNVPLKVFVSWIFTLEMRPCLSIDKIWMLQIPFILGKATKMILLCHCLLSPNQSEFLFLFLASISAVAWLSLQTSECYELPGGKADKSKVRWLERQRVLAVSNLSCLVLGVGHEEAGGSADCWVFCLFLYSIMSSGLLKSWPSLLSAAKCQALTRACKNTLWINWILLMKNSSSDKAVPCGFAHSPRWKTFAATKRGVGRGTQVYVIMWVLKLNHLCRPKAPKCYGLKSGLKLFIEQIFIDHLLETRHWAKCQRPIWFLQSGSFCGPSGGVYWVETEQWLCVSMFYKCE